MRHFLQGVQSEHQHDNADNSYSNTTTTRQIKACLFSPSSEFDSLSVAFHFHIHHNIFSRSNLTVSVSGAALSRPLHAVVRAHFTEEVRPQCPTCNFGEKLTKSYKREKSTKSNGGKNETIN